jgi:magnesium chelatase family protein
MVARRLGGILPTLTNDEALDVTRVHSAAGLNIGGGLIASRPFRAPHHSTTPAGLVGGGVSVPRPREVTLAHHGVLFLDELNEFARPTLEILIEPLDAREVVLARATGTVRYPANTALVASMLPCPCGRQGTPRCRCDAESRARMLTRVPPRLLRLFDLRVFVGPVDVRALEDPRPQETSAEVRKRVVGARERLKAPPHIWEAEYAKPLAHTADALGSYARTVRVARTIAALDAAAVVRPEHVEEALKLTLEPAELIARAR